MIAVDPQTGVARVVSDAAHGDGMFFITPESVAITATGDLIVGDATNIAMIRGRSADGEPYRDIGTRPGCWPGDPGSNCVGAHR